ncbi:MAG TPA: recombinase family protein [Planctomicrobium sp.]|nr:recombinase family protein [Planctomicrobium sp.]
MTSLTLLQLLLVTCRCFVLLSVIFSTNLAHSSAPFASPQIPAPVAASPLPPNRRRQRKLKAQERQLPQDRAASYARFSSDHQRDESITDQQRRCQEAADGNSHTLPPDLEFSDERVSGTKRNREGLNALMAAAERGEFNVLYVFSLSRLARESIITMPLLKELVHVHHVRFISVTEGIDSERTGWEFIAAFMSLVHEQYLRELSQNVLRGQEGALLDGFSIGDWCFGYSSEPVPGTEVKRRGRDSKPRMRYVIDFETAAWVKRIFEWYVQEQRTIGWIVRQLNLHQVPKDHRASTPDWDHGLVVNLLQNQKYIGIWSWGENRSERDPKTGDIRYVPRPDEECAQWTRSLPDLQIIDEATFSQAQRRLQKNVEKWAEHRNPDGRLRGSSSDVRFSSPVHLVSGLFECAECGRRLNITGYKTRFLFCPGYKKGLCSAKTQLPKPLAEEMILNVIGEKILQSEEWFQAVWRSCHQAWQVYCNTVPIEIQNLERQLADVERKIQRLMDSIENGDNSPDIAQRRAERQAEKSELSLQLKRLQAESKSHPEAPTPEWLRARLAHLGETLRSGTPAAATALKTLVGGQIIVEHVPKPGRKSYWRGTLNLHAETIGAAISLPSTGLNSSESSPQTESITLDFIAPDPQEKLIQRVRELYEQEVLGVEISRLLGISRTYVTVLLKRSFTQEGRDLPDGRCRRHDLKRKTLMPGTAERLSQPVKELWDQGLPMHEIARQLQVDPNYVTHAIQFWHTSRGLPIPDGRKRRKELGLRNQKRA